MTRWRDRIGPESLSVGRAWLAEKQNRDGGWPVSDAVPESSWMTSSAVLALFLSGPEGSSRPEQAVLRGGLWLLAERGRGTHWLVRLLNRVRPERTEGEPDVVLDSNLIGWPVVGLFLVMGLLLWVFYQQPGLMGDAAPGAGIDDTRTVLTS